MPQLQQPPQQKNSHTNPLLKCLRTKWLWSVPIVVALFFIFIAPLKFVRISNLVSFLQHKNLRILISVLRGAGEEQSVCRMFETLTKMGYNCVSITFLQDIPYLLRGFDFDLSINMQASFHRPQNCFNFLVLHGYEQLDFKPYDAILSVVPIEKLANINLYSKPVQPFLLSEKATNFADNPKTKLFYCYQIWDKFRALQCLKLYRLLDEKNYFEVYGCRHPFWDQVKLKSYKGSIPTGNDALLKKMTESGVSLILHSPLHFDNNTTTARIFESAAASNVIICDRLPFVVENFGDSVLYIDRDLSPEQMFKQIDSHMKWILSHQKEAIEMARRAHQIFVEKFSLEKILQNVIDFYRAHKDDKENAVK